MPNQQLSQEQLLERIQELETLNQALLAEKEQEARLEYAWTGNLGHWYWNIKTNSVTFNPLKAAALGYEKSELPEPVPYQFFTEKLHPDDYQPTMNAMLDHLYGKAPVYEVEYRIQAKDGSYRWFYDRGKITTYDDNGKPLFLAGIVFDITQKKETEQELQQKNKILAELSAMDGLTKVYNHRTLVETLKSAAAESLRTGKPLSAAMFDIDNFKRINDTRGHIFGDQVLVDVAAILKNSLRDTDIVGRYGGEEFMVIFTGSPGEAAAKVAERLRLAVERHTFLDGVHVTISGGVRQYGGEDLPEFIDAVDQNLYKAKHEGKNQVIAG